MKHIYEIFNQEIEIIDNLIKIKGSSFFKNQEQTNQTFTEKWNVVSKSISQDDRNKAILRQRNWYLDLYGFKTEDELKRFVQTKEVIIDAGCGLGEKSAWMAEMSPNSIVIGIDFSESVYAAAKKFNKYSNLFFVQGDIADTKIKENVADYIFCDQVIMHTEQPEVTFSHLSSLLIIGGEFSCYVYRKKALPRELLDSYFREQTHKYTNEEIWALSKQMTEIGKTLSELNIEIEVPEMPLLGIKGGKYDIQRFIYWNFMKCFWNEGLGEDTSVSCNFDWYSPSNAKRYSKSEFKNMIKQNDLAIHHFHEEEACYSGRFIK